MKKSRIARIFLLATDETRIFSISQKRISTFYGFQPSLE